MRILFLFLIRFYSLTLPVDAALISEESSFDDVSIVIEDGIELPVVCEIEKEENDENSKWYAEFIALPHSDYSCCVRKLVTAKLVASIPKFILYLNIRI
jgi:hypothetical protein